MTYVKLQVLEEIPCCKTVLFQLQWALSIDLAQGQSTATSMWHACDVVKFLMFTGSAPVGLFTGICGGF